MSSRIHQDSLAGPRISFRALLLVIWAYFVSVSCEMAILEQVIENFAQPHIKLNSQSISTLSGTGSMSVSEIPHVGPAFGPSL